MSALMYNQPVTCLKRNTSQDEDVPNVSTE